jgi:hypothetical protein
MIFLYKVYLIANLEISMKLVQTKVDTVCAGLGCALTDLLVPRSELGRAGHLLARLLSALLRTLAIRRATSANQQTLCIVQRPKYTK